MHVKNILRRFGFDVIKYHDFYDAVVRPRNIRTMIDVGANIGLFAKEFRARFPRIFIHSFEPLPSCFEQLEKTLPNDPHFKAWHTALGETAGEVVMHQSSFHPSSSLLPMADLHRKLYPKSATHTEVIVPMARLDDVLANENLEEPIMMKLDVQGFEAHVLKGAPLTLARTSVILCETSFLPLYEGQPLFADIHNLLREHGFSYHGSYQRHFDPRTNTPIYEDSIFLKDAQKTP